MLSRVTNTHHPTHTRSVQEVLVFASSLSSHRLPHYTHLSRSSLSAAIFLDRPSEALTLSRSADISSSRSRT